MKYNYRKYDVYYLIKGAITIAILVTAIIYLVTLVPNDLPMYVLSIREKDIFTTYEGAKGLLISFWIIKK